MTKKQPQAPDTWSRSDVRLGEVSLHSLPVCAAVAIAASCEYQTGMAPEAAEIWGLYKLAGKSGLAGVIEAAASTSMAGHRIASWYPWDPDVPLDGLVCGIRIEEGYHAVLAVPGGMLSWDTVCPRRGDPQEAWLIEWAPGPLS